MPNSGKPELGGRGSAPPSRRRSYSISSTSNTAAGRKALPLLKQNPRLLHRAFVVEAVLVVLDNGGDRLQRELAVGILDHVLQIEILNRDVVVAVFVRTAHRFEVHLLHLGLHRVF